MTATQGRGPSQVVQASELRAGDFIVEREWTILATKRQEDGGYRVSATSAGGLIRQTVLPADSLVEIKRR